MFAGGQTTSVGLVNPFVHIIMYTYYLLAALGPTVQKYLWWKKHLTKLQLVRYFEFVELDIKMCIYCVTVSKHILNVCH